MTSQRVHPQPVELFEEVHFVRPVPGNQFCCCRQRIDLSSLFSILKERRGPDSPGETLEAHIAAAYVLFVLHYVHDDVKFVLKNGCENGIASLNLLWLALTAMQSST